MQGPELKFVALWIGLASICCSQNKLKVVGFEYAQGPQTSPRITVQVYNWAHVQPETLAAAEDEAVRIFKKASVEIVWMNCPLSVAEAGASPICVDSGPRGPLVVRIVYDAPPGFESTCLAVALNETGVFATIFYQRMDQFAKHWIATQSQILGLLIAHELGHLLLDLRGHTCCGIMRSGWNTEDLRSASMGTLRFSSGESGLLRDAAARRTRR